jgi:hypothetical protein
LARRHGRQPAELAAHGVEVNCVAQPKRKSGHDRFGVVARTVEAAVNGALDAPTQRVEQRSCGQCRGGDGDGGGERQHIGRERDDSDKTPRRTALSGWLPSKQSEGQLATVLGTTSVNNFDAR